MLKFTFLLYTTTKLKKIFINWLIKKCLSRVPLESVPEILHTLCPFLFYFVFYREQIHCSCNLFLLLSLSSLLLLLCDCKLRLLSINHATIIYGVLICV